MRRSSLTPAARAASLQLHGHRDLALQGRRRKGALIQEQQHQIGVVGHGQGQDFPEFFRLQGEGVEYGRLVAGGQTLGQYLRVGAVQHQPQAAHLLHRLHQEDHAVLKPGREVAGVDIQNFGAGLLAAPGQFLQGGGIQVFQGRGHQRIDHVKIIGDYEHCGSP